MFCKHFAVQEYIWNKMCRHNANVRTNKKRTQRKRDRQFWIHRQQQRSIHGIKVQKHTHIEASLQINTGPPVGSKIEKSRKIRPVGSKLCLCYSCGRAFACLTQMLTHVSPSLSHFHFSISRPSFDVKMVLNTHSVHVVYAFSFWV